MKVSCGLNVTGKFTALSAVSRRGQAPVRDQRNLRKEEENTTALLDKLRCGLSETAYDNTISIGQLKCATDGGMVSELRNYIANLNTSGSIALNITKASAYLKTSASSWKPILFRKQLKVMPIFLVRSARSSRRSLPLNMPTTLQPGARKRDS